MDKMQLGGKNQQTKALIIAQKTSNEHNNKNPSHPQ